MKKGDYVKTPRFCTVKIEHVFRKPETARANGYVEPTHYSNPDYDIQGKHVGVNRMVFAAIKRN